jgi:hypothetical protein
MILQNKDSKRVTGKIFHLKGLEAKSCCQTENPVYDRVFLTLYTILAERGKLKGHLKMTLLGLLCVG